MPLPLPDDPEIPVMFEYDEDDDEPDIPGPTAPDDNDELDIETPHKQRTRNWRRYLADQGDVAARIKDVVRYMKEKKIDLPILLHEISWENQELIEDPDIRFERTALMVSDELKYILRHWHRPPRHHGRGIKTQGGREALDEIAMDCIKEKIDHELENLGPHLHSPQTELTAENLLNVKYDDLVETVTMHAPSVWELFSHAASSKRQRKKANKIKSLPKAVLYMLCHVSFMRSHHRNKLHKLLSVYLKSCGLATKAIDTFHAFGLTMSQKWMYSAVDTLSTTQRTTMLEDIKKHLWFLMHDNVNKAFRVYEQRLGNQSHFDSGTAGTVIIVKNPMVRAPSNPVLQAARKRGRKTPITGIEIFMLEQKAAPRLRKREVHHVLRILLDAADFDLATYEGRKHDSLKAPRPLHQLPSGLDHRTIQYMLNTKHMEEASYEGTRKIVDEWMRQLGLDCPEEVRRTGLERVIVWVGDQLTISRLRGLSWFCAEDFNSYDRMDYMVPMFGWFHLQMAFANSLHKQYYGTRKGLGLVQAFELLNRKGLATQSTQGPFHHHLEEGLEVVLNAHIRDLWKLEGHVETLKDLRDKAPEDILSIAERIVDRHASTKALVALDAAEVGKQDRMRRQHVQWNCDALDYLVLDDAVKYGDVGTMEDLLPRLLFRFSGGRNGNYALEVLELIQALYKEWDEDTKNFIRQYCWLGNTTGRADGYCPLDMIQEHNIRDIKAIFDVIGPQATWELIERISAAIPVLRAIKDHVNAEFNVFSRYKRHTTPSQEQDVERLSAVYTKEEVHRCKAGRLLRKADQVPDYMAKGAAHVTSRKALEKWWKKRERKYSEEQEWDDIFDAQSV